MGREVVCRVELDGTSGKAKALLETEELIVRSPFRVSVPFRQIRDIRPKGTLAITESEVMAAGKRAGLVDVKVVRFSESHTAEKFVIPLSNRRRAP